MAAIAATNIGPAERKGLEETIAILAADIKAGVQQVASKRDGDFLFHSRIAVVSRNTVLQSMPARHEVSRRLDCGYLAESVATHRLDEDEAVQVA